MPISEADVVCFDVVKERHWFDWCEHPKESYVFSFSATEILFDGRVVTEKLDAYVFDSVRGQSFCLRYGPEASDYYAVPDYWILFNVTGLQRYEIFIRLLRQSGTFRWEPET